MFRTSAVILNVFLLFCGLSTGEETKIWYRHCSPQQSCIPISSCETLNYDNFESLTDRDQGLYLQSTACNETKVCCSKIEMETVVPDVHTCGKNANYLKIIGGMDAELDDHPWMALLEFKTGNTSEPKYCAGTLINNRYVLTAAHCLANNNELKYVHLGKYDSNIYDNCDKDYCSHPTVTVGIEQIVIHDDFSGTRNDIALIRLSKIIYYTDFIKPICLPWTVGLIASEDSETLEIAGWGHGAKSSVKQKLFLPAISLEECAEAYEDIEIDQTHVCSGGIPNQSACIGDSGGPLMVVINRAYTIEGVISYGRNICTQRNTTNIPILFTRVTSFESWIKKNVRQ